MREGKIAVVGDKDLILAFKAISMETFCASDKEEGEKVIRQLAKNNYAVIFVTEDLAAQMDELLTKYKVRAYPAIIPIPTSAKSNGYGMKGIRADVERAIGTDILFNKEE